MVPACVQSIDWGTVSNICSTMLSLATIVFMVWGARAWRREFVGKRRIELGEDARAAFYTVKDAIAFIRNWELTPPNTPISNFTAVFTGRYKTTEKAFSRFQVLKPRVMATFGKDTESIFAEVNKTCWKMQEAARDADMYEVPLENNAAMDLAERKKCQDRIQEAKDVFMERTGTGHKNEIKEILDGIGARLEQATRASCFRWP